MPETHRERERERERVRERESGRIIFFNYVLYECYMYFREL